MAPTSDDRVREILERLDDGGLLTYSEREEVLAHISSLEQECNKLRAVNCEKGAIQQELERERDDWQRRADEYADDSRIYRKWNNASDGLIAHLTARCALLESVAEAAREVNETFGTVDVSGVAVKCSKDSAEKLVLSLNALDTAREQK